MINMRLGLKVKILAGLITFLSVIGVNQYQFLHATNKPLHTRQTNEQNQSQDSFVFYSVIDEWQKYKYSVNGKSILEPMKLPNTKVSFNANDLLFVLTNTRKYFNNGYICRFPLSPWLGNYLRKFSRTLGITSK